MQNALEQRQKPYLTIRPAAGWASLNLAEMIQFRDLLTTLATRDVKLRYRQTALGALWVVIQPLMAAGIFSFVFGRVAKMPSDGVPYFLFAYAGLLGWNAFSSTLAKSSACLVGNSQLISKVYFPRLILPLSTVFSTLIDFGVAMGMLLVLMLIKGMMIPLSILLVPVWLALLITMALGAGLAAAALMVSYRDVQHILPVVVQLVMYASPVAYAVSAIPQGLRGWYFLNPLAGLMEAFRWSILGRGELAWGAVGYAAVASIVMFFLGTFAFKNMERRFADVI